MTKPKGRSKLSAFEVPHPREELNLKESEEYLMKLVKERAQEIGHVWQARVEKDGEHQNTVLTKALRHKIFKSVRLHSPPLLYWIYHRFSTSTLTRYRNIYAPYAFDTRSRVRVEYDWVKQEPSFDISLPLESWPERFLRTLQQLPAPGNIEVDDEAAEAPLPSPAIDEQGPFTRKRTQKASSTNVGQPPADRIDEPDSGSERDEDESGDYTPEGQTVPKGLKREGTKCEADNGAQKRVAMAKGMSQSPDPCEAETGNEVVPGSTPNNSQASRPKETPISRPTVTKAPTADSPTPEHSPRQHSKDSCKDHAETDEEIKMEKEWWARLAIAIMTQGRRIGCLDAARLKEREAFRTDIFEHTNRLPLLPEYARCHKVESIRARHGNDLEENVKSGKWWQDVADVLTRAAVLLQVDARPGSDDNELGKLCDEFAESIYGYARLTSSTPGLRVKQDQAPLHTPSPFASSVRPQKPLLTPHPIRESVSELQKRSRPPTPSSGPVRPNKRERLTQTCGVVIPKTSYAKSGRTPSTQPRNSTAHAHDIDDDSLSLDVSKAVIPQSRQHEMTPMEMTGGAGDPSPVNAGQPESSIEDGAAMFTTVASNSAKKKRRKEIRKQAWVEKGKPGAKHQMNQKRKRGPRASGSTRLQADMVTTSKAIGPVHKVAVRKANSDNNNLNDNQHLHLHGGRGQSQTIQARKRETARQAMHVKHANRADHSSTENHQNHQKQPTQVEKADQTDQVGITKPKKRPRRKPKRQLAHTESESRQSTRTENGSKQTR